MNDNQKNFEKEINLMDLMFYCLKKWRLIVGTMLILAICAGGYKYMAIGKSNQLKKEQWEASGNQKEKEEKIINPTVEYYLQGIAGSELELKKQGEYIENSIVMQLDSNHLQTGILNFHLDMEEDESEPDSLRVLIAAYRAYVSDGRLARALAEVDKDIDVSDLQYLISFQDSTEMGEKNHISGTFPAKQDVMQVCIVASDEEKCKLYMDAAEDALLDYRKQLQNDLKGHSLELLTATQSVRSDISISNYQYNILNNYKNIIQNLQTMKTGLDKVITEEGEFIQKGNSLFLENQMVGAIEFVIIGLILGAILSTVVLIFIYIMGNKIQSINSFEEEFGIKLLGHVAVPAEKRKFFSFLDKWIFRMEEGVHAKISPEEQIKIVSMNLKAILSNETGLQNVMIAGTIPEKDVALVYRNLTGAIENITFSSYIQMVFSAAAYEELDKYDGVVFLEKKGISIAKFVRQEKELAVSRNMKVLGAVVL